MKLTDIFIRRPVLASVVSLLILVLGLRALGTLQVLQYPQTQNAVVTINTIYYGADPNVVAGFITTPLENAIAQANGIDYMTSTSTSGVSTIMVYLRLNYDADKALTEINTKISSVLSQLPPGTQQPTLTVRVGQTIDAMYIGFNSTVLAPNQITDYIVRVVQPKLQAVPGVQTAEILGGKYFALRAWLDPDKLAAYGLTAADVSQALAANNYISGLGSTKGQMVQVDLTASTDLHSLDEFRDLVLRQSGGAIVRLKDVANVTLGFDDYETEVGFDGQQAVYIGIQVAPSANLLDVINGVHAVFPGLQSQLPQGLNGQIVYDSTDFVSSAIHEVVRTLVMAVLIVTIVVFVFLGSPRSVLIPVVAIPLSLIGTFTIMLLCGFSINLLTLLALVLAIGLVVDDAIIVVENVNRHLEDGMKPMPAAIQAARELAGPIIAMTVVLVAVYVPIGFQGGLTGALFTEFAFTLVGAVTVSAIVALTLSPMMTSRLLRPSGEVPRWEARLIGFIDARFNAIHHRYERWLHGSLSYLPVTTVFALIILGSIYFLYGSATSELAPQEDQGVIITSATTAADSTLQQRQLYDRQIYRDFAGYPENDHVFQLDMPGQNIAGMVLKPWDQPHAHHGGIAAACAAGDGEDRRCTGRGVPAAAAAGQSGPADPVHHRQHGPVPAAERRGAEVPAGRARQRAVHVPRYRSAHRQAADRGGDRSQQGGPAWPQDERCRQRAEFDAGRRLCELLRPRRTFLQGDPPGAAALPAQRRPVAELLHPDRERRVGAAVHHRAHHHTYRAAVAQPLPADQRRDDPGRGGARRGSRHRGAVPPGPRGTRTAARLFGRLWRAVAAIRAGVRWVPAHLRLRAGHHLPVARRACSRASAIRSSSSSRCRCRSPARCSSWDWGSAAPASTSTPR